MEKEEEEELALLSNERISTELEKDATATFTKLEDEHEVINTAVELQCELEAESLTELNKLGKGNGDIEISLAAASELVSKGDNEVVVAVEENTDIGVSDQEGEEESLGPDGLPAAEDVRDVIGGDESLTVNTKMGTATEVVGLLERETMAVAEGKDVDVVVADDIERETVVTEVVNCMEMKDLEEHGEMVEKVLDTEVVHLEMIPREEDKEVVDANDHIQGHRDATGMAEGSRVAYGAGNKEIVDGDECNTEIAGATVNVDIGVTSRDTEVADAVKDIEGADAAKDIEGAAAAEDAEGVDKAEDSEGAAVAEDAIEELDAVEDAEEFQAENQTEVADTGYEMEVGDASCYMEVADTVEDREVTDADEDMEAADAGGEKMEQNEDAQEMEVTDNTRDVEEADEITASAGAKRKRGRNSKTVGKVPAKKKVGEDVCFICFDGGNLVLCDRRGCLKAYHPSCVNHDEAFFQTKGRWNCGWHLCSNCEKNAHYMCYTCTFSLCKACIKDAVILCVRGNKGFCEACMKTVMMIERNEQTQVDFDDKSSWEYLFKDYWLNVKQKLSITTDEVTLAKNPWKGSDVLGVQEESSNELYDNNNNAASSSDSSENAEKSKQNKRKYKKRTKSRVKEEDPPSTGADTDGDPSNEKVGWASNELLELVMHMRNGDKSFLSQFDVQALLLDYIKRNKLRDPRRKSQIVCDSRLQNLFGKPRVGHFEMLKLLESHFLVKDDFQADDFQGIVVDTEANRLEGDGNSDVLTKAGKDKKRRSRRKGDGRGYQSNLEDYAAIDNHNINLIYLRRNLVEELLEDTESLHDKVVGAFVRIRISGSNQKQDLYRLVQVVGTTKAAEPYKVGKRTTDILLEILNLNKTEVVSTDIISNQEFTEDECKRLRQSIKCGLINRLTVGDIQEKSIALQAVRVKDWLEAETARLSHLRDRASEKGRRKELRECVEKLQLLKTPEERQRRLEEIPEIQADPNMDPSHESDEDEGETDDKRQDNNLRPRGGAYSRRVVEPVSPGKLGSASTDSWSGTRNYSAGHRDLSRSMSNKGLSNKGDDLTGSTDMVTEHSWNQGRDRGSNNLEKPVIPSRNSHPMIISESPSGAMSENLLAAVSTGVRQSTDKINETEKMWHYRDPSGKIQGPFSMVQLRKWNNNGYFPTELKIWRISEKEENAILLSDALAGNFVKEPVVQMVQSPNPISYSGTPLKQVQSAGEGWKSEHEISPLKTQNTPSVETPKYLTGDWRSDYNRNDSTNLPSPTPAQSRGETMLQAYESKWSPNSSSVQPAGLVFGRPHDSSSPGVGLAPAMGNAIQMPSPSPAMPSESHYVAANARVLSSPDNSDVNPSGDLAFSSASLQKIVQSANAQQLSVETPGWHSGSVQKPGGVTSYPVPGSNQAWGSGSSQLTEQNNPIGAPAEPSTFGQWGTLTSASPFITRNQAAMYPTPTLSGFPSDSWRIQAPGQQPNIRPHVVPNIHWGLKVKDNARPGPMPVDPNMGLRATVPGNMNWGAPGQGVPQNANPGWHMPAQMLPPVNANAPLPGNTSATWVSPGQGPPPVNPNLGWGAHGQGQMPGTTTPGWSSAAPTRHSNQMDRGRVGDSERGGNKHWNRQQSFGSGSSRPNPRGQRVCDFHKNGHCRKGAACDYLHT